MNFYLLYFVLIAVPDEVDVAPLFYKIWLFWLGLDGLLVGALEGLVWPDLLGAAELPPTFVEVFEFEFPIPPKMLLPAPNLEEESLFWKPLLDVTYELDC